MNLYLQYGHIIMAGEFTMTVLCKKQIYAEQAYTNVLNILHSLQAI